MKCEVCGAPSDSYVGAADGVVCICLTCYEVAEPHFRRADALSAELQAAGVALPKASAAASDVEIGRIRGGSSS